MSKICSVFMSLILVFPVLSLFAQEVDLTGTWELTEETPQGEMTSKVHFDQDEEDLTVTMKGPRGDKTKGKGTLKGNKIEWTVKRNTPRGKMTMTYTGTVKGNTMSGSVQIGDFASSRWKAERT